MSEIQLTADDLQAVITELTQENTNLRLMKSALSRKIKEQAAELGEAKDEKVIELVPEKKKA